MFPCYFLEEISSVYHSIVFLYFFALIPEEGFLISPCYSLNSAFKWVYLSFSPLPFTSLVFIAICLNWVGLLTRVYGMTIVFVSFLGLSHSGFSEFLVWMISWWPLGLILCMNSQMDTVPKLRAIALHSEEIRLNPGQSWPFVELHQWD